MKSLFLATCIVGTAVASQAETLVIDQSFENYGGYASVSADWRQAQTFTASMSGFLVRIDAALRPGEIFDLTDTADVNLFLIRPHGETPNYPPGDVIATASARIPNPNFERLDDGSPSFVLPFQWVQFQLPNISIQNGEVFAFALQSGYAEYQWAADFQSNYLRGDGFWGPPNAFQHATGSDQRDYLFRTYVTSIPEPTTSVSLAILLVVLACPGRFNRRWISRQHRPTEESNPVQIALVSTTLIAVVLGLIV
jgi:hypothetical protein